MTEDLTLPDNWHRDPDQMKLVMDRFDTFDAASRATGVAPTTLSKWWLRHGFEPRGQGQKTNGATIKADSVGAPVDELDLAKKRIKTLEGHLARVREAEIAEEAIVSRLEDAIAKTEPAFSPTIGMPGDRDRVDETAQDAVLLFSDTHASETVSEEETEGMNAYDWDIMVRRMARLQESVLSHLAHQRFPIRQLHVLMLGDMLSGDIHEELAITNDRPAAEAAVDLAYETARWLDAFVPHFGKVVVRGVPGNHPRATKKPQAKMAQNNGDWLMYKMCEIYHRGNPNIDFQFKRGGYQVHTIADNWRTLLMHGDGIRSTMPGVPWGGVIRRITTLEAQFMQAKNPIDYVVLGHFHTRNELDGVGARTFMNGSVKGLDEYSLKQFGSGRPASQTLLTFHPKRGWTGTFPIDLQDRVPQADGWA